MSIRSELIAALPGAHPWGEVVDLLVPVVERIAARKAAGEIRDAAADVDDGEFSNRQSADARAAILRRADALDPS